MEVDVVAEYEPRFQQPYQRATAGRGQRLLRLLVGDASGARSQLSVPYQKRQACSRTTSREKLSGCLGCGSFSKMQD